MDDMDLAELQSVLDRGETFTVEFKRASPRNVLSDSDIVEAVTCLANGQGGLLLLGVEDDGAVTGVAPRHGERTDPSSLTGMILNLTDPHWITDVEVISHGQHDVVVIQVPPSRVGPVGTRGGVFKRRSIKPNGMPECIPYRPSEMMSAGFDLSGLDYATLPARGASMEALDPAEFDRLRRLASTARGDASLAGLSDLEILRALRLDASQTSTPAPSLGAVLLFGTRAALERWTPTAECLFQDFRSGTPHVNEGLRLPLLAAAEALEERVRLRNASTEVLVGMQSVQLPLVASAAAREVIANALVHRSYAELGPILVQFSDDALTVSSPGGFPVGVTVDNLLEQSRPRSVALADAFKRAGLVDRRGKGINEMFNTQLRAGRDAPDYSKSTTNTVQATLATGRADLDLVRFILNYENSTQRSLGLDDLRMIHHLRVIGPSTASEIAEDLHLTPAGARGLANRLVEKGLIEVHGTSRNRRFHLAGSFYDLAQDRNALVRVSGVDTLKQEQMIIEFVRRFKKITRAEAASLIQTSPETASRLLRDLARRNALRMVGQRRAAHYVLGDEPSVARDR